MVHEYANTAYFPCVVLSRWQSVTQRFRVRHCAVTWVNTWHSHIDYTRQHNLFDIQMKTGWRLWLLEIRVAAQNYGVDEWSDQKNMKCTKLVLLRLMCSADHTVSRMCRSRRKNSVQKKKKKKILQVRTWSTAEETMWQNNQCSRLIVTAQREREREGGGGGA